MKQLLLNSQAGAIWDLVVTYNDIGQAQLSTVADKNYIAQKAKQLLLTGKGEIFHDTEYGTPWFQEILGKGADLGNIRALLLDVLDSSETLKELGVTSTSIENMELDKFTRRLMIKDLALEGENPEESVTLTGVSI